MGQGREADPAGTEAIRSGLAGWASTRRRSGSTGRPTPRRSATRPRTVASGCDPGCRDALPRRRRHARVRGQRLTRRQVSDGYARPRVHAANPRGDARMPDAERQVVDEDPLEELFAGVAEVGSRTGTRPRRLPRNRRAGSPGRRGAPRRGRVTAISPSSVATFAGSGLTCRSSASIAFGADFQTRLNQSTRTTHSARLARCG